MRILIVGAGIAGLTTALRLRGLGHDAVIMERSPQLRAEGYMIDFFGPGYDIAEKMGILADLAAIHYPIRHLVFVDRRGRPTADLDYPTMRRTVFGDHHFNFMRGDLESVLYEKLIASGGSVRFGVSPTAIESAGSSATVRDSNGSYDTFDLVVGADGVHSQVRELALAPTDWRIVDLGCHTAAYIVPGTIGGLLPDAFVTRSTAGATVGAYPIRGNRTATFFVYRAAGLLAERTADACRHDLNTAFRGRGWIVDPLLDAFPSDGDVYYDDVTQVVARHWSRGRIVLLGDAAGCVSLVAGQGASMAMAGAYVLAEEIGRHELDVETALARYEARLRPPVEARQRAGRRNAGWFLPHTDLGARLRDYVMTLAVKTPFARLLGRSLGTTPIPLA